MGKRLYIYNVLNAIQVAVGVTFQFLLARHFGAGAETDVCFLSATIVAFLSGLALLFSEMFLQHYNDLFVSDPADAGRFYQAVLTLSLLVGGLSYVGSVAMESYVVRAFAGSLDPNRYEIFRPYFGIHATSLIWARALALNNSLVNARMRFLLPYVLGVMTQLMNVVFLVALAGRLGINSVAIAAVASGPVALVAQHCFIAKELGIALRPRFWHPRIRRLAVDSFSLRLGNQIWTLRDLLTSNILAGFPAGTISVFSYAMRIMTIVFSVTNSPILQIFQAKASRMISEGRAEAVNALRKEIALKNVSIFLGCALLSVFFLPLVLRAFFSASISSESITQIHRFFFCLIPVHLVMAVEMPYVQVIIALKRGTSVLMIAIGFILIFCAALFAMLRPLNIYALPAAMFLAQAVNLWVYMRLVGRFVAKRELNGMPCL